VDSGGPPGGWRVTRRGDPSTGSPVSTAYLDSLTNETGSMEATPAPVTAARETATRAGPIPEFRPVSLRPDVTTTTPPLKSWKVRVGSSPELSKVHVGADVAEVVCVFGDICRREW
jgi:hypothetical protein